MQAPSPDCESCGFQEFFSILYKLATWKCAFWISFMHVQGKKGCYYPASHATLLKNTPRYIKSESGIIPDHWTYQNSTTLCISHTVNFTYFSGYIGSLCNTKNSISLFFSQVLHLANIDYNSNFDNIKCIQFIIHVEHFHTHRNHRYLGDWQKRDE